MIEIMGAAVGFLGSAMPSVLKYFQDKSNKQHELKILELQNKMQTESMIQKSKENIIKAEVSESAALYKTFYSGIKWIDALNGTVRPVIAYCFFGIYAYTKVCYVIKTDVFIFNEFWSSTDNAIFLTIIAFYYGQRSMQKILGAK